MSTVHSFAEIYTASTVKASRCGYLIARDGSIYIPRMHNSFGLVLMYMDPVACGKLLPKVDYHNPTHLLDNRVNKMFHAVGAVAVGYPKDEDVPFVQLPVEVTAEQGVSLRAVCRVLGHTSGSPVRVAMDVTLMEMLAFCCERTVEPA